MSHSFHYVERPPTQQLNSPPPLLVLLHGLGSNERDLFAFAPHLDGRYHILSVRAPRTYYQGYAWFDLDFSRGMPQANSMQLAESQRMLRDFLENIKQQYSTDRLYLGGFSQGAIMSYLTTLTQPSLVSGVLAMSGYIMKNPALPSVASDELKAVPILATHGTRDQVLPVFLGRSTRDYLQSLQLNFQYQEYPMGHEVSPACFEDCRRWLAERVADMT